MSTMTAEPRVIEVKRYVCPFCSRGHSKDAAARAHIGRCWKNPNNRACLTCANYGDDPGEPEIGLAGEIWCAVGIDLRPASPLTNCAAWKGNSDAA